MRQRECEEIGEKQKFGENVEVGMGKGRRKIVFKNVRTTKS